MRVLLLYIHADESTHREVNPTFGHLIQEEDPNPYVHRVSNFVPHKGTGKCKASWMGTK